jgi:1-acyl-sn-glycerol-3-phosphate acyltransferase
VGETEFRQHPEAIIPPLLWRLLHWPFWIFCRVWIRVSVEGKEHLDPSQGGLMLINHQSYLDPLIVAVMLTRPVSFLARDNLFRIPILGWVLRATWVIPISREATRSGSIRTAVERLSRGFLVGMFPEGTRSSGTTVTPLRPGFLAVARRTDQPVYPVGICGTDRALPRGAWFIRPVRIQVVYGPALSIAEREQLQRDDDDSALCKLIHARVSDCVMRAKELRSGVRRAVNE